MGASKFFASWRSTPEIMSICITARNPPKETDEVLKYVTEMVANYMEHVVLQTETLPTDVQESWKKLVKDAYARSPVVREHLRKFADWCDPRLHELVENVQPSPPSQPTK